MQKQKLFLLLIPPTLSLIALHKFSTSFFLAKKSFPHTSQCTPTAATDLLSHSLNLSPSETRYLANKLSQLNNNNNNNNGDGDVTEKISSSSGCWMPRRVQSLAIIVIDALRFDFAASLLPRSVGRRLHDNDDSSRRRRSQLFQFVADPPTVTMQRLKGLTTGGLPTFADISKNFGGADIDEDSWVQQMVDVDVAMRRGDGGGRKRKRMAFVGDDTWVDLFPTQFDESHPYPSFNTRDLDTVDNGCLKHLPRLLRSLGPTRDGSSDDESELYEAIIVHFLGVDHVGHTYGPHDEHMTQKLNQMDDVLVTVFDRIDSATEECQVTFVFGDHGMTEDGNHGGGTAEEVNAGLFAHFSPGCGDLSVTSDINGAEIGSHSTKFFNSIHQIDLVPTISLLLGLPIPYANIGGVAPTLLPPLTSSSTTDGRRQSHEAPYTALALALNAAQVWNYLNDYSKSSKAFPAAALKELKERLEEATRVFQLAMGEGEEESDDSLAWREAAGLFKVFLGEANELGRRVWTKFDTMGMGFGIFGIVCVLAWDLGGVLLDGGFVLLQWEVIVMIVFMVFYCVLLPFSNSYIMAEQHVLMMSISVICMVLSYRRMSIIMTEEWFKKKFDENKMTLPSQYALLLRKEARSVLTPMLLPICSRLHELLITGHGMDASLHLHKAHHPLVFISSLLVLGYMRSQHANPKEQGISLINHQSHLLALACLGHSWWEKQTSDPERNGHYSCLLAIAIPLFGIIFVTTRRISSRLDKLDDRKWNQPSTDIALFYSMLILVMAVTGPSAAPSALLFLIQMQAMRGMIQWTGPYKMSPAIIAALFHLTTRHAFFSTNHACAFNRLQYSAAFVISNTFHFATAGCFLFCNTFGWEVLGGGMTMTTTTESDVVWRWYLVFQELQMVGAVFAVTLMRRHLMVWAIFAPKFVFECVFWVLRVGFFCIKTLL